MKITKAVLVVEIDNSGELRQVFIENEKMNNLIIMIENGFFHDGEVTICDKVIDTIAFKKEK